MFIKIRVLLCLILCGFLFAPCAIGMNGGFKRRNIRACTYCRIHKKKCDGGQPCTTCGLLQQCVYPIPLKRGRKPLHKKEENPTNMDATYPSFSWQGYKYIEIDKESAMKLDHPNLKKTSYVSDPTICKKPRRPEIETPTKEANSKSTPTNIIFIGECGPPNSQGQGASKVNVLHDYFEWGRSPGAHHEQEIPNQNKDGDKEDKGKSLEERINGNGIPDPLEDAEEDQYFQKHFSGLNEVINKWTYPDENEEERNRFFICRCEEHRGQNGD